MPSSVHENRALRFWQVVLTLLTIFLVSEVLPEKVLNGARLGTFPKPDFRINFTLKSNQGAGSFKEIRHGLNKDPFYVRVYAKPRIGNNSDFCFNGIGSSQSSPSKSSYGGLIFAYNSEFVRIWAPTDPKGHVVFVKDGWGGEINIQESNEAEVVVEVWKDGPAPTFQIEHVIDTRLGKLNQVYHQVDHELRQLPERVVVRLSPVETDDDTNNPNKGFWFHAIASSQNPDPNSNFGGVIFAYNERYLRLWAPDGSNNNTGCIFVGKEWAGGVHSQGATKCRVETLLWVNQLPVPAYQTDWFPFNGQRDSLSFTERTHGINILPAFVVVQVRALNGMNVGYVFEAQGATQSDDDGSNEYGGVVFAYNENKVRIWVPSRHDGSKKGYPILIKSGWGYGLNLQKGRDNVEVRIVVYSSKCNSSAEVLYDGDQCVSVLYNSYKTIASQWSDCSSICNNGTQKRSLTGCEVAVKKPVLSCDFENGMCGWSSAQQGGSPVPWIITNTSTPEANTGPLWGHPKGSHYIYTHTSTASPNQKATLTSPNIHGASKCELRFFWNMYGSDIGTVSVHVNTKNPDQGALGKWQISGWNMTGDQGDIFWRAAFVDLEKFKKVYQIRFVHTLPESNCGKKNSVCTICKHRKCPAANVAIDNIELVCQKEIRNIPVDACQKRTAVRPGCEMLAVMASVQGPAYSERTIGLEKYVKATGSRLDLIAIYEFEVQFTASYAIWKHAFNANNETNDVSLRVDEGDWFVWRLPNKGSHALWTQYYLQTFQLRPGIHRISLRQEEYGFQLSKLALVPVELLTWADLGMQSRHIPDGSLYAFPFQSQPDPRFGRLHAEDAWCSSDQNHGYVYYQITLPQLALLSGISIQGGKDILMKLNNYWVISFKMKVSLDGYRYTWYRDTSGRRDFTANNDGSTVVTHTLMFTALVRGVRIYPWLWQNWICLRTELYGYYLSSEMCASSGPATERSKPCVGDRNCGQNAECTLPQASRIQKQVMDGNRDNLPDNVTEEFCHCYHGYHGPSCQHYGCSSNPCLNGGSCSEANGTFSCSCPPGYHGNTCQHPCKSGYYGNDCSQKCRCTKHGTCDIATGHCNCRRGYHGTYCEQGCSPGYFGYDCAQKCQCRNGASCDPVTGLCNCTLGWTGALCDKPCRRNTWGVNCTLNCSCWKSAKFCHRFTGKCVCSQGYFGEKCQYPCPSGTYGLNCSGNCQCQNNATCSKEDGTCNCTQAGWTGVLCHQSCPGGYYGVNCIHKCKCQHGAACDLITGSCTCSSGYSGQFCDKPCIQGYWGTNCSIPCSCVHGAHCNPVNGACMCRESDGCQCDAGWSGSDCSVPCSKDAWGPNCTNTCLCEHSGVCNQTTGSCLCPRGYTGLKCESPCPAGRFGQNCTHKCTCASSSSLSCYSVDGTCLCIPGFTGPQCNVPCPAGSWGANCSQSCSCVSGSCHPVFGNCTCDRGWQGLLCNQICSNCSNPCPKCYHGNGTCDQASGKCQCSPGYQGSSCLESCSAGYYGDKCHGKCDCADDALCHHVTGRCLCKPGRTGTRCDKVCPQGTFGQNCTQSCSCVRGSCRPEDGSCVCPAGYHGYLCDRPVSQNCSCANGAVCDHNTGQCSCRPGWTGLTCQRSCRDVSVIPGFFGANCSERCICPGSCDPASGTCSCPRGFQGPNCAQACPRGLYGDNCQHTCSCMNGASCDHVNGACTCTPGWSGVNCTDRCPSGYYGMLCASVCPCSANGTEVTASCDAVTGLCNCRPGYQGYKCEEQCSEGFFGKNCSQHCTCKNSDACSVTDGTCTCKPGYYGKSCQLGCPPGRYGVNCSNTCQCVKSNTKACDRADGTCTCAHGYTGVFCESVCPDGWYGHDCADRCTCQNGAICDHVSGFCTCTAGFEGPRCEKACDEGSFGANCAKTCLCKNGAKCNRFTGECKCASGFYGIRCERECANGRFGVNCENVCDCNLRNSPTCDPSTGACLCSPGFKGIRCDEPCADGFYGNGCTTQCPVCSRHVIGPCQKAHGNCSCSPGYQGYLCYDDCSLDRYGLHCKSPCKCPVGELCHHINGMCLDISRGKFSLIVSDTMEDLDLLARKRHIKRGLERLMVLYFDAESSSRAEDDNTATQARLSMSDGNNGTSATVNDLSDDSYPLTNEQKTPAQQKHVFMVRLLELQPVVKENLENGTRVVCVLLDNFTVVDGHYVDEVLSRVKSKDVSSFLAAEYYTGKLWKPKPGSSWIQIHLPLIIGVSVGFFLILVIIALFALIRRRYKQKCGFAAYKKSNKDQSEFELQPWIGRNTGYLLAFDNPYYDVLAAMGLDDDVEEDYYNPLYDDVSVYSDSGENTSEDSCHKDLSSMVIRTARLVPSRSSEGFH